jgi:membrane protein implicated in regulation of membrane protease activity
VILLQATTGTPFYDFVLALVATPAVGNLLAALAALISAAAAYLVWRTRRDLKGTEAQLHRRIDRLAATTSRPPPPPREAP